jgi:hypothetical protein
MPSVPHLLGSSVTCPPPRVPQSLYPKPLFWARGAIPSASPASLNQPLLGVPSADSVSSQAHLQPFTVLQPLAQTHSRKECQCGKRSFWEGGWCRADPLPLRVPQSSHRKSALARWISSTRASTALGHHASRQASLDPLGFTRDFSLPSSSGLRLLDLLVETLPLEQAATTHSAMLSLLKSALTRY